VNSALQRLFHLPAFRRLVFALPTDDAEGPDSIPLNLQRLFCLMQVSPITPRTTELTRAMGWEGRDAWVQDDASAFVLSLLDFLEDALRNTENADGIARLFRIRTATVFRCLEIDYTARSEATHFQLQACLQGNRTLEQAIAAYVAEEALVGDAQYTVEGVGKFDAVRSTRFVELPPVLNVQLLRFDAQQKKIGDYFEFPFELDMQPFVSEDADMSLPYRYELMSVLVHFGVLSSGHFDAYCRPTPAREWFKFNDHEVKRVDEAEAIAANFGGGERPHSAYFLVYVRQSEIGAIMEPISNELLASHLLEYFAEFKQKHSLLPPEYRLRVFSEEDFRAATAHFGMRGVVPNEQCLTVPGAIVFRDFGHSLLDRAKLPKGANYSLWMIGVRNCPTRRIDQNLTVQKRFQTSPPRIFVGPESPVLRDEVPLLICFYDPCVPTSPIEYLKFFVVSSGVVLGELAGEVARLKGVVGETLAAFDLYNSSERQLDLSKSLAAQNVGFGRLVFERVGPPLSSDGAAVWNSITRST
jgi:hypothetical protein